MSGAQKWMDKLKEAEKTCLVSDGKILKEHIIKDPIFNNKIELIIR